MKVKLKRTPVVGDWVRLETWNDGGRFYEIARVSDKRVDLIVDQTRRDTTCYWVDGDWLFRDPEITTEWSEYLDALVDTL